MVGNRNIFQYAEVQYLQIGRGAVEWFPGAEDDKEELMGLLQLKLRKVKKERDVTAKSSGLMGTENGDMVG